jgi:2-oxoglutarate dehydrogenase E1 component
MKQMEVEFKKLLDENFDESKEIKKNTMDVFMAEDWKNSKKRSSS